MINLGMIFLMSIFLISFLSASFCCERVKNNGPWCQSMENEADCDASYNSVATSCDATSYCRTGTCIDNNNGICTPNTAQRTCTENGGAFDQRAVSDIPQCQLGCCLIGEQAAFVTQVRCESLASDYGQESDYRADITDQMICLASANPSEKGACVFTNENNQRDCDMITREECQSRQTTTAPATEPGFFERIFGGGAEETIELTELGISFYAGFLCSAEELNTICGPRGGTACEDDGRVYFKDTCGNLANVYDSDKLNNNDYWTYMREPTCDDGTGNKGSSDCGDCDYLSGSICKQKKVGESVSYGNFICRNLDCLSYSNTDEGFSGDVHPKHGERWCAKSSGVDKITATTDEEGVTILTGGDDLLTNNLPGSGYYIKSCSNSEVTIEPCAEFRGQVCVQSDLDGTDAIFRNAVCKTQIFTQCYFQNNSEDCENRELRDCRWMETGYSFSEQGLINKTETEETKNSNLIFNGVCVPLYAPGFDRISDDATKNGAEICPLANSYCVITYKLPIGLRNKQLNELTLQQKKDTCTNNCHCLYPEWQTTINSMCVALGDCGTKNNLNGRAGEEREVVKIDAAPTEETAEE